MAGRVVFDVEMGSGVGLGLGDVGFSGFALAVTWTNTDGMLHWDGAQGRAVLRYLLGFSEIVGFNLLAYDNKVLAGYLMAHEHGIAAQLQARTIDLHHLLYRATGRRFSLDEVAQATLGMGKLPRPQSTRMHDDPYDLGEYCQCDVELTRDLDDYRRQYGMLWTRDGCWMTSGQ